MEALNQLVSIGGGSVQQSYGGYQKPDVSQAARYAKQHAQDDDDDDDSKWYSSCIKKKDDGNTDVCANRGKPLF